jgi:hypothetical protein
MAFENSIYASTRGERKRFRDFLLVAEAGSERKKLEIVPEAEIYDRALYAFEPRWREKMTRKSSTINRFQS